MWAGYRKEYRRGSNDKAQRDPSSWRHSEQQQLKREWASHARVERKQRDNGRDGRELVAHTHLRSTWLLACTRQAQPITALALRRLKRTPTLGKNCRDALSTRAIDSLSHQHTLLHPSAPLESPTLQRPPRPPRKRTQQASKTLLHNPPMTKGEGHRQPRRHTGTTLLMLQAMRRAFAATKGAQQCTHSSHNAMRAETSVTWGVVIMVNLREAFREKMALTNRSSKHSYVQRFMGRIPTQARSLAASNCWLLLTRSSR